MAQETVAAAYPRLENADAAQLKLESIGIPKGDIAVCSRDTTSVVGEARPANQREPGFFEWLFGSDVPDEDRAGYERHVSDRNGAILSVRADSSRYDEIAHILERYDPISLEQGDAGTTTAAVGTAVPLRSAHTEEVIPTTKEELEVGKRRVGSTGACRVRRYVAEHPVEEQVALHDETVTVERRQPVQAPLPGERPGEEVVVRKEGRDRIETVHDTVRKSKVDVDKAAADKPPAALERR